MSEILFAISWFGLDVCAEVRPDSTVQIEGWVWVTQRQYSIMLWSTVLEWRVLYRNEVDWCVA